jgi:uncharacterized membrane protein
MLVVMNVDRSGNDELVVLHYASPDDAERAFRTIQSLSAEGFVELTESALVTRDVDGRVTARQADHQKVPRTSAMGGVAGLVVGGLMGVPVIGILAGAGLAAKKSIQAKHLERLISTVGNQMKSGQAVLVLSIPAVHDAEVVLERLDSAHVGLVRADIPDELRAEIDRQTG